MIPRLATRTPRSRVVRCTRHQPRLESLAAEFALLTQRRARAIHQIALLDQQRHTAGLAFERLQARIAWLVERMDLLSPDLRGTAEPEPPPPPPAPTAKPANSLAAIGRHWTLQGGNHPVRPQTRRP